MNKHTCSSFNTVKSIPGGSSWSFHLCQVLNNIPIFSFVVSEFWKLAVILTWMLFKKLVCLHVCLDLSIFLWSVMWSPLFSHCRYDSSAAEPTDRTSSASAHPASIHPTPDPTAAERYHTSLMFSLTVFNIDNNKKCLLSTNQYIRMISEGSCDTEDWSNDAEN